jgi:hypothetical protein
MLLQKCCLFIILKILLNLSLEGTQSSDNYSTGNEIPSITWSEAFGKLLRNIHSGQYILRNWSESCQYLLASCIKIYQARVGQDLLNLITNSLESCIHSQLHYSHAKGQPLSIFSEDLKTKRLGLRSNWRNWLLDKQSEACHFIISLRLHRPFQFHETVLLKWTEFLAAACVQM